MILEQKRKNIVNKLLFRVGIIIICILLYILSKVFLLKIVQFNVDFIYGILASAFVWGLVELLDFIFELHNVYIKERHYFLLTYKEGLYKLRDYVKEHGTWNKNKFDINIDYSEFCLLLHQLREKLVFFQRDFQIFSLTKEIVNILGYIERLYSFINSNSYKKIYLNQELSETEKDNIFNKIIYINFDEQSLLAFDDEKKRFNKRIEEEKNIRIEFEEFKGFFANEFSHMKGNLTHQYFMIPQQQWVNIDFKPINDLMEYESKHKSMCIVCMLYQILFYRYNI